MEGTKNNFFKDRQFLFGLLIGLLLVLAVAVLVGIWLGLLNGPRRLTDQTSELEDLAGPETESIVNPEINTFELKKDAQLCQEDGRPAVYLFSIASCSHCQWIKETFDETATESQNSGKIKAYHFDVETGDDLLTAEIETQLPASAIGILNEFDPQGYVPVFVFGCQYFRIGNGYEQEDNLANEAKEFVAVIAEITK